MNKTASGLLLVVCLGGAIASGIAVSTFANMPSKPSQDGFYMMCEIASSVAGLLFLCGFFYGAMHFSRK